MPGLYVYWEVKPPVKSNGVPLENIEYIASMYSARKLNSLKHVGQLIMSS